MAPSSHREITSDEFRPSAMYISLARPIDCMILRPKAISSHGTGLTLDARNPANMREQPSVTARPIDRYFLTCGTSSSSALAAALSNSSRCACCVPNAGTIKRLTPKAPAIAPAVLAA